MKFPTIRFVDTSENTGPVTINDGRVVTVIESGGSPVFASDLKAGEEFEIDLATGVISRPEKS